MRPPSVRRARAALAVVLVTFTATSAAGAQVLVRDRVAADVERLAQMTGARVPAPVGARSWAADPRDSVALRFLGGEVTTYYNTARPWGVNDGAVWQGRGATMSVSAGAAGRIGPVHWRFEPVVTRSENRAFALSPLAGAEGRSPYAYPTLSRFEIDMPQRMGPDAYQVVDWGRSAIEARYRALALGFSHENLWWGPGVRNAITMTNNAPGFWHAFVGTSQPADVRIGTLGARWIWGSVRESRWFDTIPANDRRFLTGAVVTFSPRGVPGLELGGARVFQQAWRDGGPSLDDLLLLAKPFQKKAQYTAENPAGEDDQDQIASLFVRWVLPSSGLELYGEWGRGDHSRDFRDLLVQPEHGSGWLLGFQKAVLRDSTLRWRLGGELALLGAPRTTLTRSPGAGFFYVHGLVKQGYTNRGQVMGAGIGPGSSQAMLKLDRFTSWGRVGAGLLRTAYDLDRFYRRPPPLDHNTPEVEPSFLMDAELVRGPWTWSAGIAVNQLMNQHYIARNDRWNTNLVVGARYAPR